MFSLPLIAPSPEYSTFLSSHARQQYEDVSGASQPQHPQSQQQRRANQQNNNQSPYSHASYLRSLQLGQLKADEDAIRKRKENIARLGSTWIKPPGVAKTLQAETEERLEREEQEMLAQREQLMADLAARQAEEEARQAAAANQEQADAMEERDLDEEVPDADDVADEDEEDEDIEGEESIEVEDQDDEEETGQGEVTTEVNMTTFGDESLLEGSMVAEQLRQDRQENQEHPEQSAEAEQEALDQQRYLHLEEAEVTGIAQDQYELGMEANLDDSVPEAGTYEHTDTELEDESSEEEDQSSSLAGPTRTSVGARQSLLGRTSNVSRQSMHSRESAGSRRSLREADVSSLLESSFVGSSPMLGRLRPTNARQGRTQ